MDLPMYKFMAHHFFSSPLPDPDVDLTGKTCLITGANQGEYLSRSACVSLTAGAGLGYAVSVKMARRGAERIIIASRNLDKCKAAATRIYQEVPSYRGVIDCMQVDMSSFESVRSFARQVEKDVDVLSIALLNAGKQASEYRKTVDGYEETLQVNVIATGLLAVLLLPKLQASRKLGDSPHLSIVSSDVHHWPKWPERKAEHLIEAFNNPKKFDRIDRYQTSKLMVILFIRDIAALPDADGVIINSVAPGWIGSSFFKEEPALAYWLTMKLTWSPQRGSTNLLAATTMVTKPGAYVARGVERPTSRWSTSSEGLQVQEKLWGELVAIWRRKAPEVNSVLK